VLGLQSIEAHLVTKEQYLTIQAERQAKEEKVRGDAEPWRLYIIYGSNQSAVGPKHTGTFMATRPFKKPNGTSTGQLRWATQFMCSWQHK